MPRRTLALVLLALFLLATPAQAGTTYLPLVLHSTGTWYAFVTDVVDGDTVRVSLCGMTLRVRYIGIDTPDRGQCYYAEAKARNTELVLHKTVLLVRDTSEADRYRRLLRYIYTGDTFVNAEFVRGGYARAGTGKPDVVQQPDLSMVCGGMDGTE